MRIFCSRHRRRRTRWPSAARRARAQTRRSITLPSGEYDAGDTKFSIDLGFPFRYAIKPEIAIVALQTLMSIDFNAVSDRSRHRHDGDGSWRRGMPVTKFDNTPANGAKPDLNPSVGIATNPIAAAVGRRSSRSCAFPISTRRPARSRCPVTGRIEFSPNQKFDIGLEFTLLNVKPPEGQSPIDNRFLALFVQSRFGK